MYQVEAQVISNVSFCEDVARLDRRFSDIRLVWLNCPPIAAAVRPGQFVMVKCADLTLPRPLSVHQVVNDSIALLFAVLADGKGTTWLAARKPEETVQIFGPLGNGFSYMDSDRLLLVGGGMGVAPLFFLADEAIRRGVAVTLLLGAKSDRLLYPADRIPFGVEVFTATDDGSAGRLGLVTALIPEHAAKADRIFTCGPLPMYRQMKEKAGELGLAEKAVFVSLEAIMGCGHGVCYSCTIKTGHGLRQVCKDGPVFDFNDLVWGEFGL
jgi:dihydroorotate dehydrogenase electron transfer subunit